MGWLLLRFRLAMLSVNSAHRISKTTGRTQRAGFFQDNLAVQCLCFCSQHSIRLQCNRVIGNGGGQFPNEDLGNTIQLLQVSFQRYNVNIGIGGGGGGVVVCWLVVRSWWLFVRVNQREIKQGERDCRGFPKWCRSGFAASALLLLLLPGACATDGGGIGLLLLGIFMSLLCPSNIA